VQVLGIIFSLPLEPPCPTDPDYAVIAQYQTMEATLQLQSNDGLLEVNNEFKV
jgi:hypothetical protein